MTKLLLLFYEFFKIGLFAVGGGLATLPFLYDLANRYPWMSVEQIPDMVAISESTPGPLGINMATYAGFQCNGVLGSIVATIALVTPSIIIIILVSKILERFRKSSIVNNAFYGLRPAVVGLVAAAGFTVISMALFSPETAVQYQGVEAFLHLFHLKECILFLILLLIMQKKKIHPVLFVLGSAVIGIVFAM